MDVLRQLPRALVPGGAVVDLIAAPPAAVVETDDGRVLGEIDDNAFFARALAAIPGPVVIRETSAVRRFTKLPAPSSLRATDTGLESKGVLVTGGSGGIGAACVRAFAAEGARVFVHFHRGEERARSLAEELGGAPIGRADLTDEAKVDRLFEEARAALGAIDVCVEVQGVWPREDVPVWELPLERWESTLRENLTSTFLVARAFLREVERSGHGSLVLVGSTAGVFGEAGHADYAAAKSAVLGGLLLSLKNEMVRIAPLGRVNAVAPGWTESPMTRGLVDPERVAAISRTMALRKVARPEDVARQVVVLASDELSGHVTGQVVVVAGGMEGRTVHPD